MGDFDAQQAAQSLTELQSCMSAMGTAAAEVAERSELGDSAIYPFTAGELKDLTEGIELICGISLAVINMAAALNLGPLGALLGLGKE